MANAVQQQEEHAAEDDGTGRRAGQRGGCMYTRVCVFDVLFPPTRPLALLNSHWHELVQHDKRQHVGQEGSVLDRVAVDRAVSEEISHAKNCGAP